MDQPELRIVTPDKYWTVYRGKHYLGSIAYRASRFPHYTAVHDGQPIGEGDSLDSVKGLFNHIGNPR